MAEFLKEVKCSAPQTFLETALKHMKDVFDHLPDGDETDVSVCSSIGTPLTMSLTPQLTPESDIDGVQPPFVLGAGMSNIAFKFLKPKSGMLSLCVV